MAMPKIVPYSVYEQVSSMPAVIQTSTMWIILMMVAPLVLTFALEVAIYVNYSLSVYLYNSFREMCRAGTRRSGSGSGGSRAMRWTYLFTDERK